MRGASFKRSTRQLHARLAWLAVSQGRCASAFPKMRLGMALFRIPSDDSGKTATRRGIATSTGGEFGTVRRHSIGPSGCRVRQFHARFRSGFGPASRRYTAYRAGRAPKRHPLAKLKKLSLRDLMDASFIWFPRRACPALYDRLMHECYRGGLTSPRIVQEGLNEATILSLVSTGLGVGWVLGSARWRCPETVAILRVVDLNVPLTLALAWRRDNTSPLLANFIREVAALARSASGQ